MSGMSRAPSFHPHPADGALRHRRVDYAQGLMRSAEEGLMAAAGDLTGKDVLVLGSVVSSTMCALTMSECRHAESRLPGCRVEHGVADVVLMPQVTLEAMPGLIKQAVIALDQGGVLAVRLPRVPRHTGMEVKALLTLSGFRDLREVVKGGERLLTAGAPAFPPIR